MNSFTRKLNIPVLSVSFIPDKTMNSKSAFSSVYLSLVFCSILIKYGHFRMIVILVIQFLGWNFGLLPFSEHMPGNAKRSILMKFISSFGRFYDHNFDWTYSFMVGWLGDLEVSQVVSLLIQQFSKNTKYAIATHNLNDSSK